MTNPAVVAATSGGDTASVEYIDYSAWCAGYDTEECILKALEDGEIEMYLPSPDGAREYDVYRLTAKGRRAADRHLRIVYQRSAEVARKQAEEDRQEGYWAKPAVGRAPPVRGGATDSRKEGGRAVPVAAAASAGGTPLPNGGRI